MSNMAPCFCVSQRLARAVALAVLGCVVGATLSVPVSGQALGPSGTQHLYINILEGEGALNNIRQRDAREPVVQVTDENHKPVAGVALLFLIHAGASGGSATFNGGLTLSTTTDAQGIAHAAGLQVAHTGSFTISVTASVAGQVVATAVIHQAVFLGALNSAASSTASQVGTQVAKQGILHLSKTALIATGASVAAATAVVVTVVVVNKNNSTTLTLGSTTVGHP
jgi:hypothetical protein